MKLDRGTRAVCLQISSLQNGLSRCWGMKGVHRQTHGKQLEDTLCGERGDSGARDSLCTSQQRWDSC